MARTGNRRGAFDGQNGRGRSSGVSGVRRSYSRGNGGSFTLHFPGNRKRLLGWAVRVRFAAAVTRLAYGRLCCIGATGLVCEVDYVKLLAEEDVAEQFLLPQGGGSAPRSKLPLRAPIAHSRWSLEDCQELSDP